MSTTASARSHTGRTVVDALLARDDAGEAQARAGVVPCPAWCDGDHAWPVLAGPGVVSVIHEHAVPGELHVLVQQAIEVDAVGQDQGADPVEVEVLGHWVSTHPAELRELARQVLAAADALEGAVSGSTLRTAGAPRRPGAAARDVRCADCGGAWHDGDEVERGRRLRPDGTVEQC